MTPHDCCRVWRAQPWRRRARAARDTGEGTCCGSCRDRRRGGRTPLASAVRGPRHSRTRTQMCTYAPAGPDFRVTKWHFNHRIPKPFLPSYRKDRDIPRPNSCTRAPPHSSFGTPIDTIKMLSRVRSAAPVLRHVRYASAISVDASGALRVPNDPIVPFIEGDGTGPGACFGTVVGGAMPPARCVRHVVVAGADVRPLHIAPHPAPPAPTP